MLTKNQTKIQIVKELLDKKVITFEQCLILLEESNEKVFKTENRLSSHYPYNPPNHIYSNSFTRFTSHITDDSTI